MAYRVVERLDEAQVEDLHRLYQNEWWCNKRTLDDVKRMLENTDILVGVVDEENSRLVGFARVLTDRVYRGTVYDVIVSSERRGTNLGKVIMDALLAHPDLSTIEVLDLFCKPDMEPFYEKWGFARDGSGTNRMCRGG